MVRLACKSSSRYSSVAPDVGENEMSPHVEDLSEIVAQCWSCNEAHSTPIVLKDFLKRLHLVGIVQLLLLLTT